SSPTCARSRTSRRWTTGPWRSCSPGSARSWCGCSRTAGSPCRCGSIWRPDGRARRADAAARGSDAVADRTACGDAGLRGQGIRPGGHPDGADTRTAILAAARRAFAEKGFDNATIRGIAREAGVDPALVHHYFGTKAELFATAMRLPVDPREVAATVLAGPREEVGERLVRCVLGLIAEPET